MADFSTDLPQGDQTTPSRTLIGVGVTGHRLARLDSTSLSAISEASNRILDTIGNTLAVSDSRSLRLITALADGVDSLVADEAIARGWTVDAVLPFTHPDYATDFAEGDARQSFQQRLSKSHAVLELPGSRTAGDGIAYERAGRVVLSQCDILIAVWDGQPARGRGGAGQIVAEAVLLGMPVIHIDSTGAHPPQLLWDGLIEHGLGQQTLETVPRGDLSALPRLLNGLIGMPDSVEEVKMLARAEEDVGRSWHFLSLAYPLLLAIMGVRSLKKGDLRTPPPDDINKITRRLLGPAGSLTTAFSAQLAEVVAPRFARADTTASSAAQLFRSGYVVNFSFAALAVLLSLLGLALPGATKPVLIALEVGVIAVILLLTRAGNRAGWHRRWLDNRHLAERLRCLAISAQLGDLDLRADAARQPGWVGWYVRVTARQLGLPHGRIDSAYLDGVRQSLATLINDQIAYLKAESHRMHHLEHRLHLLGTWLFGATAVVCLFVLVFKLADKVAASTAMEAIAHPLLIFATIATAGLPAIGAAIYGIRMQGDFAGTAQRSEALARELTTLRTAMAADDDGFDTLVRRVKRASDLLTEDLASWLQTYHARPLALPG